MSSSVLSALVPNPNANIRLMCCDGAVLDADVRVLKQSATIRLMMEHCGWGDETDAYLPLHSIPSVTMRKVLEWMENHKDQPPFPEHYVGDGRMTRWEKAFFDAADATVDMVFNMVAAAHFLKLYGLVELGCKSIADRIHVAPTAEAKRRIFYNAC